MVWCKNSLDNNSFCSIHLNIWKKEWHPTAAPAEKEKHRNKSKKCMKSRKGTKVNRHGSSVVVLNGCWNPRS